MKKRDELTVEMIHAEEDALIDFQFAILAAMQERGISQVELARDLGVSRARVSQLLSSDANPTLKLVGRALKAVGLKVHYQSKGMKGPLAMEHRPILLAECEGGADSWRRVERKPKLVANDDWPDFRTDIRRAVAA